jgi:hypothetical protein
VLEKYYGDPDRYTVSDGHLYCGASWGVSIDDAVPDHVMVFLGDLGRDVPDREQAHWKAFNVSYDGTISETAYRRSELGQFASSDRLEHRFVAGYNRVNDAWSVKFGWSLFKAPRPLDSHILTTLRVPANGSIARFDEQIIGLAKLVVDSLNEEKIGEALSAKVKGEKGIQKLERLLTEKGILGGNMCDDLRVVQGARSRSAAHRKGEDFELAVLLDDAPDLVALFARLLEDLIVDFDVVVAACSE